MNKMLTTKQVAELFGVDSRTVLYNFIPKGLRYFRVGKKDYRFDIKDIEEFKSNQKERKEITNFIDNRTETQKRMNKKLKVI